MSIKTHSLLFHLLTATKKHSYQVWRKRMILKTSVNEFGLKKQLNRVIVRSRIFVEQTEAPECGILCSRTRWLIARAGICAVSDPVHTVTTPAYYNHSRLGPLRGFIHNGFPTKCVYAFLLPTISHFRLYRLVSKSYQWRESYSCYSLRC
jgi:hypothetical protein